MKITLLYIFLFCGLLPELMGQSQVAITIDDVPNTHQYEKDGFKSRLLEQLDSLDLPVAIFINEGLLYKNTSTKKNLVLLKQWAKRKYITLGNHTYRHSRYSQVGFHAFMEDVEKGEKMLDKLALKYRKRLKYFRFPFNDLGEDSLQHAKIEQFLKAKDYQITPFTVESSDWMFNYLYEQYLEKGKTEEAKAIGKAYIDKTLALFDFFDSLSLKLYGRQIKQIYLCHDNTLNADYLATLVDKLQQKNYSFISLEEALEDKVYESPDVYYKKWGVSWVYRWMTDSKERSRLMRSEPSVEEYYKTYQELSTAGE
ncbi:polysaccharide deacetylase family protein [Rapidithrix thailandica]|uniref:Polysaccharide deacetylase family protein n=1 Tax=Rapidithrix thailandica TaxID=413964 RepID=A0AAW9RWY8_9BACT